MQTKITTRYITEKKYMKTKDKEKELFKQPEGENTHYSEYFFWGLPGLQVISTNLGLVPTAPFPSEMTTHFWGAGLGSDHYIHSS